MVALFRCSTAFAVTALCTQAVLAAQRGLRGEHAQQPPNVQWTQPPLTNQGVSGQQPSTMVPKSRLFFLFMTYHKINNEDIWDRFFATAVQGVEYRALVHCKATAECRQNIKAQHRFEIIKSVETTYCSDLVSGMNALLRAALAVGGVEDSNDKMIFVSDSTLPIKPFSYVQRRLTIETGPTSDFCIFPRDQWAEVAEQIQGDPVAFPRRQVTVKHHQWVILSRAHARMAVERSMLRRDLMQQFQLNKRPGWQNSGCLDEYWHFAVLFPGIDVGAPSSTVALTGLSGGGLNTANNEPQGVCDTYLHWTPRNSGHKSNFTQVSDVLLEDPGTDVGPADEFRPSTISRLSKSALLTLRNSNFLFARKVEDGSQFSGCGSLSEAFDAIVFSEQVQDVLGSTPMWVGQGVWYDNRQTRVSILALEGAVKISWSDSGTTGKGSYCGNRIAVVFSNGYKASAMFLDDGVLRWSNGVEWRRVR